MIFILFYKPRYICKKLQVSIQIVALSATLTDIEVIQQWLKAESYLTNFRPVELLEMIKIGRTVYDKNLKPLRELPFDDLFVNDLDNIGQLVIETLKDGFSVLIFCSSKDGCERLCLSLAKLIHNVLKSKRPESEQLKNAMSQESINEIKTQLRCCFTGLDSAMDKIITYGCFFHHSGKPKKVPKQ